MSASAHPSHLSSCKQLLLLAESAARIASELESRRRLAYQPRGQTLAGFLERVGELEKALGTLPARAGAEAEAEVHNSAARLREALLAIRPDPSRPLWELYLPTVTGEKAKAYREAADHWHKTVSNCRAGTRPGSQRAEPEQAASNAQSPPSPRACGATAAAPTPSILGEPPCFQLRGAIWHVRYGQEEGTFPQSKGMQYIARLLAQPHKPIAALVLQRGTGSAEAPPRMAKPVFDDEAPTGRGSFQVVHDGRAAAEYRRKCVEYDHEIAKAEKAGNTVEAEVLRREKEKLLNQLRGATGLGGRRRALGPAPPQHKAKDAVRKRLNAAYDKMRGASPPMPGLVQHLADSIRAEGSAYVYRPCDPVADWQL